MKYIINAGIILVMLLVMTGCTAEEKTSDKGEIEAEEDVVAEETEIRENTDGSMESETVEYAEIPETIISTPEEPEIYGFIKSGKEYFSDALFIGDSRTMGLKLYGTIDNADYFATPGLNLYTIPKAKLEVGEHNNITLEELLEKKDYKKIYLMLGINELGYDLEQTLEKYTELVQMIQSKESEAIIYICANLHVTKTRHENDEVHNNTKINEFNIRVSTLANSRDVFYLDINQIFDDEEGNLGEEFSSDDSHVKGEYYTRWCDWLQEHTVAK